MKTAIPMAGMVALLVVFTCAGFAPQEPPSPTPLPPARLDIQILPVPGSPTKPDITSRYPMVIVEADASQFPMPVTQGRIGNYPIRVIPPSDLNYSAPTSRVPSLPGPATPLYVPVRPKQ